MAIANANNPNKITNEIAPNASKLIRKPPKVLLFLYYISLLEMRKESNDKWTIVRAPGEYRERPSTCSIGPQSAAIRPNYSAMRPSLYFIRLRILLSLDIIKDCPLGLTSTKKTVLLLEGHSINMDLLHDFYQLLVLVLYLLLHYLMVFD